MSTRYLFRKWQHGGQGWRYLSDVKGKCRVSDVRLVVAENGFEASSWFVGLHLSVRATGQRYLFSAFRSVLLVAVSSAIGAQGRPASSGSAPDTTGSCEGLRHLANRNAWKTYDNFAECSVILGSQDVWLPKVESYLQ